MLDCNRIQLLPGVQVVDVICKHAYRSLPPWTMSCLIPGRSMRGMRTTRWIGNQDSSTFLNGSCSYTRHCVRAAVNMYLTPFAIILYSEPVRSSSACMAGFQSFQLCLPGSMMT
jgi:hypothetical protein